MSLEVIEGDLLEITEGILCHQVNCQGVMGSGIAKLIKDKWPKVFNQYQNMCGPGGYGLGDCQMVYAGSGPDNLWIANIFGQDEFGGNKPTNYGAVGAAFQTLHINNVLGNLAERYSQIYVPYLMGCGLGGGDWEVYSEIIEYWIPNAIVVKLPEPSTSAKSYIVDEGYELVPEDEDDLYPESQFERDANIMRGEEWMNG